VLKRQFSETPFLFQKSIPIKPVVGTIDLLTKTTEGIKNTTTVFDKEKQRARVPRAFQTSHKALTVKKIKIKIKTIFETFFLFLKIKGIF
jgi:hypothetical protein